MTSSSGVRLVRTTQEHCDAFLPGPLPYRIRGFTAMHGDKILGIGGLAAMPDGTTAAFLEVSEETARKYPIALYKAAKATLEHARERGVSDVRTRADGQREASERFLARLGFERIGMSGDETVWQWRPRALAESEA